MAEPSIQKLENHAKFYPLFHFVTIPLLTINLIIRVVYAVMHRGARLVWWEIVVAIALLALAFASRIMVLTVQDRLIMLEERLRMQRVLPSDLQARVGDLSRGQLISLRFCTDEELPELTRSVLTDNIRDRAEIKKKIRNWRADNHRA